MATPIAIHVLLEDEPLFGSAATGAMVGELVGAATGGALGMAAPGVAPDCGVGIAVGVAVGVPLAGRRVVSFVTPPVVDVTGGGATGMADADGVGVGVGTGVAAGVGRLNGAMTGPDGGGAGVGVGLGGRLKRSSPGIVWGAAPFDCASATAGRITVPASNTPARFRILKPLIELTTSIAYMNRRQTSGDRLP